MSPSLQKLINELAQLAPKEQWQVMAHLMSQLQHQAVIYENNQIAEVEKILRETESSWGRLSLDEIDTQLAYQRQFDWGD